MKEASGELSMTAVAVIAIGAITVIFTTLVLPSLKTNITRNSLCAQAYKCDSTQKKGNTILCHYLDDEGKQKDVYCKETDVTVN